MKHRPLHTKRKRPRRSLRLPDLEHAKAAVLNSCPALTPSLVTGTPSTSSLTGTARSTGLAFNSEYRAPQPGRQRTL